jgi:predicted CopG family antitoxin
MAKTVRIDEETYRRLCEHAGKLQTVLKRSVSLDETIRYLTGSLKTRNKISDLAGSWDISDQEAEAIKKGLVEGWKRWTSKRYA